MLGLANTSPAPLGLSTSGVWPLDMDRFKILCSPEFSGGTTDMAGLRAKARALEMLEDMEREEQEMMTGAPRSTAGRPEVL